MGDGSRFKLHLTTNHYGASPGVDDDLGSTISRIHIQVLQRRQIRNSLPWIARRKYLDRGRIQRTRRIRPHQAVNHIRHSFGSGKVGAIQVEGDGIAVIEGTAHLTLDRCTIGYPADRRRIDDDLGTISTLGTESYGRAVEVAKTNGMFTFLDEVDAMVVPDDLAEALGDLRPVFDGFTDGRRKQALYWVKSAKRPQTRADRIEKIVAAAAEGRSVF